MVDYYGFKVFHPSSSNHVIDRVEWCKKNNIQVITRIIRGIQFAGETFCEDDLKGKDKITVKGFSLNVSKMMLHEIGVAFFFNKEDAVKYRLVWS